MDTRKLTYREGHEPHCQAQIYQDDGDGKTIAITYSDEGGTNAAELVKRWNAYPELVAFLEDFVNDIDHKAGESGDDPTSFDARYDDARALLTSLNA